jgi:hypothetical protein
MQFVRPLTFESCDNDSQATPLPRQRGQNWRGPSIIVGVDFSFLARGQQAQYEPRLSLLVGQRNSDLDLTQKAPLAVSTLSKKGAEIRRQKRAQCGRVRAVLDFLVEILPKRP